MHLASVLLIGIGICCILPAVAQSTGDAVLKHLTVATPGAARATAVAALLISRGTAYPGTIHLSGKVEIRTPICLAARQGSKPVCDGYMVLHADEATLKEDTGEIEAHGQVRVSPAVHTPAAK